MIHGEEEFLKAFTDIPQITVVEEYRAYYDHDGWITGFGASGFPDGDNWIHIDRVLYSTDNWANLKLVDGKIIKIEPVYTYNFQLTSSTKGVKVVKNHAGIVVEQQEEYTDIEFYDNRNNRRS